MWHACVTDLAHVFRRFFCGPHAKKSAALAKQQKKKPKGKGKGKTMEESGNTASLCAPILVKVCNHMYACTCTCTLVQCADRICTQHVHIV